MVKIIPSACRVDGDRLIVVLESESLAELLEQRCAKFAVDNAYKLGWADACLNGQSSPAPYNGDDTATVGAENSLNDYKNLAKAANEGNVRYRKEVYIVKRL